MKYAWDMYVQYAWGQNELKPISKRGHSASVFGNSALGATIVDSLDTLHLMGLMDEFKKGRDWVASSFNFNGVCIQFVVSVDFLMIVMHLIHIQMCEMGKLSSNRAYFEHSNGLKIFTL